MDGKFICDNKRDKFKLSVVRLTPRFSNRSDNIDYCTLLLKLLDLLGYHVDVKIYMESFDLFLAKNFTLVN